MYFSLIDSQFTNLNKLTSFIHELFKPESERADWYKCINFEGNRKNGKNQSS